MKKHILISLCLAFLVTTTTSDVFAKKESSKKTHAIKKKAVEKQKTVEKDTVQATLAPNTSAIEVLAPYALLIDAKSGKVLLEKRADEPLVPSSMTKIMTAYLIADMIEKKKTSLDAMFTVSEKAWRAEGTRMFMPLGSTVSLSDLLRGIIIQSGNDACIAAAEGISGSEENFVHEMNDKAKELGLNHTVFKNTHGCPEEGHTTTARDLVKLAQIVIKSHPEIYKIYKEIDFTYNGIKQGNRNPLLYKNIGCDGIKTGHSESGGYGLVASCADPDGQRYILLINGLKSMNQRASESVKLISWARQNFVHKTAVKAGQVVETAPVWLGEKKTVSLIAQDDAAVLLTKGEESKLEIKAEYESPLQAPIQKGQVVGKVLIKTPSSQHEFPLIAGESIEKAGIFQRLKDSIVYLIWGETKAS